MTSAVNFQRDAQGQNTYAPSIDNVQFKYSCTLEPDTEQHFTLPPNGHGAWLVTFQATPGFEVWYAFTPDYKSPVTAVVPTGSIALTDSELLTGARTMAGNTYISMITPASYTSNVNVSILLWNIPWGSY